MIRIQRILCPTDLSTESDEALRYAVALALANKASLVLLYCREPGSIVEWSTSSRAARVFEQSLFTHLDASDLKTLDWEPVIAESNDVGSTISEEAAKRNVDLIVMRSRRRPLAVVLLGSTAEKVSRTAPCPVLVTHPSEREWAGLTTSEVDLHKLLVPYDASADADLALKYALSFAQECQAEIHLLHVLTHGKAKEIEPWPDVEHETLDEYAAGKLQRAIPKEAFLWCKIITAVRYGEPPDEILAYAKEYEIDLICMGASGEGFMNKLFGSTVDQVLRHAPCPVLVSRPVKLATTRMKAA